MRVLIGILFFFLSPLIIIGQVFSLDTTFEVNFPFVTGTNSQYIGGINDLIEEVDGKILVVGAFDEGIGNNRGNIVRLFSDGRTDYSWYPSFFFKYSYYASIQKNLNHYIVNFHFYEIQYLF